MQYGIYFRIYSLILLISFSGISNAAISKIMIPVEEIPEFIDPHNSNSFDLNKISKQVYPALLQFDDYYRPSPNIIKSWKIRGNRIDFELLKGIKFSNNEVLTSSHVKASLIRSHIKESQILKYTEFGKNKLKWFHIINENKFSIFIQEGLSSFFLRDLAGYGGSIVLEKNGRLYGTGQCRFSERSQTFLNLRCLKNGRSFIISYLVLKTEEAIKLFNEEKIHYLNSMQFPFKLEGLLSSHVIKNEFVGTMYIGFNFNKKPIPLRFRKRIQACIQNRDFSNVFDNHDRATTLYKVRDDRLNQPYHLENKVEKSLPIDVLVSEKYKNNIKFINYFKSISDCYGEKITLVFDSFYSILQRFRNGEGDLIYKGDGMQNYAPASIYDGIASGSKSNVLGLRDKDLTSKIDLCKMNQNYPEKIKCITEIELDLKNKVYLVPLTHIVSYEAYSSKVFKLKNGLDKSFKIWEFPIYENINQEKL